jgi:hypothetical protein
MTGASPAFRPSEELQRLAKSRRKQLELVAGVTIREQGADALAYLLHSQLTAIAAIAQEHSIEALLQGMAA